MHILRTIFFVAIYMLVSSCVTTPVTGKKAFIILPFSQELQLGNEAYRDFLSKEQKNINNDPKINEIVKRVAGRIAKVSDMPNIQWDFKVVNSTEANAFCLPGGKIVVYTGILSVCKNEAGLAAVIAHEVAHAVARHGAQRISEQMIVVAGMSLADLSLRDNKYRDIILSSFGLTYSLGRVLPFSRENEYEADEIGTVYMARAGYDPNEAVFLWNRFSSQYSTGRGLEFLSTHPYSEKRAERLKKIVVPKALLDYQGSAKYGAGAEL